MNSFNKPKGSMQVLKPKGSMQVLLFALLLLLVQSAFAHTRLKTPEIDENAASHGSNYNDVAISHGCQNTTDEKSTIDTLGTVVLFPDGKSSILTVDGAEYTGTLSDFVTNWGSPVTIVQNRDVFTHQEYIIDTLGNKLGFWAGGGSGLKAGYRGLIPFATAGVIINPDSCARSVTFNVSIGDICEITDVSGFSNATVQLWTAAVGSEFDGVGLHGYNSPATLKVNRTVAPLPESCGEGVDVVVKPSAEQMSRDFKIMFEGQKIWPQ